MNGPDNLSKYKPQSEFISELSFESLLVLIGTIYMAKLYIETNEMRSLFLKQ